MFRMYEAFNDAGEFEKAELLYRGFLIYQGVRNDFLKHPVKKGLIKYGGGNCDEDILQ